MIQPITDIATRQAIVNTRDRIVDNYVQFSETWLSDMSLRLTASENTAHPFGEELSSLATALSNTSAPVTPVIAVTCEPNITNDDSLIIRAQPTINDLIDVMDEFMPYNFLLFPQTQRPQTQLPQLPDPPHAALFLRTLDVRYFAGSLEFLEACAGPIATQQAAFKTFVDYQLSVNAFSKDYLDHLRHAYNSAYGHA